MITGKQSFAYTASQNIGASIGAGAVIMCGVTIGKFAMVAAGSVVLEDVPEFAMVAGNPARIVKSNIKY